MGMASDSSEIEAASRKAHPLEELPGTPRNRTGEFRLQFVRGGSIVEIQVGRVPLVPLITSNLSTGPA